MLKIKFVLPLICALLISGCNMKVMPPFERRIATLDKKGIVLMTITFENRLDSSDGLVPITYLIGHNDSEKYKKYSHHFLRNLTENKDAYLIVMNLNEGNHFLYSIRGHIKGDVMLPNFEVPILSNFEVKTNEIAYVGNIHMILRNRSSDSELRAGPFTPLLDQAVIANTTFDVKISDLYEKHVGEFERVHPLLTEYTIVKKILSPWKKPSIQEFEPKKTHIFFFSKDSQHKTIDEG